MLVPRHRGILVLDLVPMLRLVGHSAGGGEVARYLGAAGGVAKAALVSAVPPVMLKADANPEGLPMEVFDGPRAGRARDRSQRPPPARRPKPVR